MICVRAYRGFVSCTYHSCIVYVSCDDTIVVDLLRYIRDTNFDTASGYLVDFWEEVPEISQAYQDITCAGCRHDTVRIGKYRVNIIMVSYKYRVVSGVQ